MGREGTTILGRCRARGHLIVRWRDIGDRGAILYALNAQRGPMYVMNGAADEVMDIPHHEQDWFDKVRARAIAVRGTDKDMFTTVFYPGISHRTSWVDRDGVEWLERQIHFGIWTEKEIATAPVTHVSTWAKANDVDITPELYAGGSGGWAGCSGDRVSGDSAGGFDGAAGGGVGGA